MILTVSSNCCVVTSGSIGSNQTICVNGDPSVLTSTIAGGGNGTIAYRWERSTVDCSTGFTVIAGAISASYDPPAGLTQTTYFRRVAVCTVPGNITCEAISNCVTVTINNGPVVNPVSNITVCVGNTVPSVIFTSNTPGATFQWSRTAPIPDIGLLPVSSVGNVPAFIGTNTTSSPITSTFTVTATSNGCTGSPRQFTITIIPRPVITLTLPFDTVNNNTGPITLSGGSPAGGVYSGPGINAQGQLVPSTLLPGNYSVIYQYNGGTGCAGSASDNFTIITRASRINIYPNPATNGALSISSTPEMVGAYVKVYNAAGQLVAQWTLAGRLTRYQFKWAAGIYIFEFRKENTTERKTVMISR
jgi:hypothetical protein